MHAKLSAGRGKGKLDHGFAPPQLFLPYVRISSADMKSREPTLEIPTLVSLAALDAQRGIVWAC